MKDVFIDIGSTFVKWTASGKIRRMPFPPPTRDERPYYEVDPEAIADIVRKIIDGESADRAFISVQMHGYVLLCGDRAVTDYVSWRDERAAELAKTESLSPEYGVAAKTNLPRLSVRTQTVRFDEFCSLGSYICRALTGKNVSHITDLAATGFYNVRARKADDVPFRLPRAEYDVGEAGTYGTCRIFTPVGDQQASVLGATKGEDYDGYILNLGTAGQLCCISPDFVAGEFESRPYFGGKTLCTVTRLTGGAKLDGYLEAADGAALPAREYSAAMKKLPKRTALLVTGGAAEYRRSFIEKVCEIMGMSPVFASALGGCDGLKILADRL